MTNRVLLSLVITALIIGACNNSREDPTPALDPDTGKSYFFLVEGKFREYDVYEILYFGVDISDTLSYQLREEVKAPFTNPSGEVAHLIHRFSRANSDETWELDSVWSARVNLDHAISVENNRPIVKMTFPVIEGETWDGNLFNTKDEDEFIITSFNQFFQLPNTLTSFQEAMIIEHHMDDDLITERDNRREVYADSIGLVYKEYEVLEYCSDADVCTVGAQIIQSGRFYRETLTAHGIIGEEGG